MQRVTGIGGTFLRARDAERLREWYREHLGLAVADWGGVAVEGREAGDGSGGKQDRALGAASGVMG